MRTPESKIDRILLKSNQWDRPKVIRTKLEKYRSAIFNLYFCRAQTVCSIKKFFDSVGVRTSTAAISSFVRTRFPKEVRDKEKVIVAKQLEFLKEGLKNDNEKSRSLTGTNPKKAAKEEGKNK